MIVSPTEPPPGIPDAEGTAMNHSTPLSPLARAVLTRIQSAPVPGRAAIRRVLLGVGALAAVVALAWAAQRDREESALAAPSHQLQIRPAVPLTPARRIAAPSSPTTPTTEPSIPAPANR